MNLRSSDSQSIAEAWPLISAGIEAIQRKRDAAPEVAMPGRVDLIIRAAARSHNLTRGDILGRSHLPRVVAARYEAMRAVAKLRSADPNWPSAALIARWFNRDPTTVIHALGRLARSS